MSKTIVSVNISDADVCRVAAAALNDEAKVLRKTYRQLRRSDRGAAETALQMALYLESRAEQKYLHAEQLDAS